MKLAYLNNGIMKFSQIYDFMTHHYDFLTSDNEILTFYLIFVVCLNLQHSSHLYML